MAAFLIICFLVATSSFVTPIIASVSTMSSVIESDNTSSQKKPINHVIVIMQGKRSFDHYFGKYPGADGLSNDTKIPLYPNDLNGTWLRLPFPHRRGFAFHSKA